MTSVEVVRTYPHPIELVWRAITTRELLAEWLMENDFEPRVGHGFTFRTEPGPGFDGVVRCVVLALEPPAQSGAASMRLSWKGGPIDTTVVFDLRSEPGGTRFTMTQSGFRGLKAWLVSRILKAGCKKLYGKRLPAVLARLAAAEARSESIKP